MKPKFTVGTPFRSIRHHDNQAVSVSPTPERAVERSLQAPLTVPREHPAVDPVAAKKFKPSRNTEAETRIGVPPPK